MAVTMQSRLSSRPQQQAPHGARPAPIAIAAVAAAAAAPPRPTPATHRPRQRRRLVPPAAALPSFPFFGGNNNTTTNTTTTHPLWSYLGSAVEPLHPEQAALMHRLAFARRPSATHVVVVFSSRCAACRAAEDEVERFASGLMHELRFRLDPGAAGDGGSNGRLRVSSLDVTPSRQSGGANNSNGGARAAEVAGRLLGVEELPTAVMFIEGAPGCIRVGPKWRPDKPALTAERLLRVVNAARTRALGGGGDEDDATAATTMGAAGPPLELVEGAHWPLGRDLLGLPPLWGEESVAALGGVALEEELRRAAVGGEGGEEGDEGAAARPSEASAMAAATNPRQRQQQQQQKQQQHQPRPTQLAAIAPSASASYWSRPGKAAFWLGIAGAATLLWLWDAFGGQRAFERWQLARRTAARARGVRFSREVNEMDATDVLMDAIERAGAARARAGTTTAAASGFGRGGGGGGKGGVSGQTPADALAAAEAEASKEAVEASSASPSWGGGGGGGENAEYSAAAAAAIDVVATDVPQGARRREQSSPSSPPPDASAR